MYVEKDPPTRNYIGPAGSGQEPDSPILNVIAGIFGIPFFGFMVFYVGCLLYILAYGLYRGLVFPVYGYPLYVCLGTMILCLLWVIVVSEWRDIRKNPLVCFFLIVAGLAMMVVSVLGNTSVPVAILTFLAGGGSVASAMSKFREGLRPPALPPAAT